VHGIRRDVFVDRCLDQAARGLVVVTDQDARSRAIPTASSAGMRPTRRSRAFSVSPSTKSIARNAVFPWRP
jgi:hypothetical protein